MRVVCDCIGRRDITKGQIYESRNSFMYENTIYISIMNDLNMLGTYLKSNFISLKEYRKQKLNKIYEKI